MTNVRAGLLVLVLPVQLANRAPALGLAVIVKDLPSSSIWPLRLGVTVPLPLTCTTSGAVVDGVPLVLPTVTDPVMNGCTEQLYGKLPAVVNVLVKVKPVPCTSESHKAPSLVVECADAPVQVHLTWSFTLIFTLDGAKAKSMIFTLVSAARPGLAPPTTRYPKKSERMNRPGQNKFLMFSGPLVVVQFRGSSPVPGKVRCSRPGFVPSATSPEWFLAIRKRL